jgi:fructokinase
MEMWVSGTGIALDYRTVTGKTLTTQEIVTQFEAGDREAAAAMGRFEDRLARGLAQVINILDPDVIVVGGGVSRVKHIYRELPKKLKEYVFGGEASTPILPAMYGDSSGVRGAAWLWPNGRD